MAARAAFRAGARPRAVAVCALLLLTLPASETGDTSAAAAAPVSRGPPGGRGGGATAAGNGLFASESSFRQYLMVVPPRRQGAGAEAAEAAGAAGAAVAAAPPRGRATLMLDLDKTCLWGNDGNDLGLSLQWMEKPPELVRELYAKLVHPGLRPAYEAYRARADVDVVIYTRRPQLLQYRSCVTGKVLPLRYEAGWHHGGQVHIPSSMHEAEAVLQRYSGPTLDDDEEHDVLKGLERLLAARDAVANALGLSCPPPVVVTATEKDVEMTARHLGLDESTAVLYDDNAALQWNPRVVHVEPFVALPRTQQQDLLAFLNEVLPVEALDEDLLEYLEGANPVEQALRMCPATGRLRWWIPKRKGSGIPKWHIPPPLDAPREGCARNALKSCGSRRQQRFELNKTLKLRLSSSCGMLPLELYGSRDGRTSPVTEPSTPDALDCAHKTGALRRACTNLELVCANIEFVEARRRLLNAH